MSRITCSGFASSADHRRSQAAGFEGHIDKPFDADPLEGIGAAMAGRFAT